MHEDYTSQQFVLGESFKEPIVTVMIPTRKRISKLVDTVKQLVASDTSNGDEWELSVMIDNDDTETIVAIPFFAGLVKRARVTIGPRLGYTEIDGGYFATMERHASTHWVWVGGDDMLVTGDWIGQLKTVPRHGCIVQPEMSKLGPSEYPLAENQAFPIFPKFAWKEVSDTFPRPMDTHGCDLLKRKGWKTHFLAGVTMWHDRPTTAEIEEHRKM